MTATYQAVYVGRGQGLKEPFLHVWRKISGDGSAVTDDGPSFGSKGKQSRLTGRGVFIGDVYEITEEDDGTCKIKPERVSRWDKPAELSIWKLADTAAAAIVAANKKAKELDYDGLTLAELRQKYLRTIGRGNRAAILATIIQYVTT